MAVRPEIQKIWDESMKQDSVPKTDYGNSISVVPPPSSSDTVSYEVASEEDIAKAIGGQLAEPEEQQVGGQSVIGKIFDVLNRFGYASANTAEDYLMGKPFNIQSAIQGIKGERKATYDQIADAVFSEWSPWKRKAIGFALSIVADPSTYVPAGILAKPFQVAKETKIGQTAIKAAEESTIGKAFVPGAGLPKPYYEAKYYAKKGLEAEEQRIFRQAEKLRSGITKEEMEQLSYLRQHPDKISELSPKLKEKLEHIGSIFDDFVNKAEADGIINADMAAKWRGRDVPYLPGYYPARGIRLVKGELPPSLFEKVKKPEFMKRKKFETLEDAKLLSGNFEKIANAETIEEANGLIKSFELEDAFGKIKNLEVEDIRGYAKQLSEHYKPEENVVKLVAYRGIEQARYTARVKFIDDVMNQFGSKIKSGTKVVPEGYGIYMPKGAIRFYAKDMVDADTLKKALEKYGDMLSADDIDDLAKQFPSITKKVPTYALPESIAKDLNSASLIIGGDPSTRKIAQMFDRTQNLWKGFATAVRLPFHMRNMYSNWWQAYLAGVKNPTRFVQAAQIQKSFITKTTGKVQLGDKVFTYKELRTLANDLGVRGKGWLGADIDINTLDEIESMVKYGKLRKLNPMQMGRAFGTAIEDNSRFAVFLDQMAKGKTPKEASQVVRKYLFDYEELTEFERKVMKRAIPFYTWTRKNAPLQVENLIKQPRKYQAYAKGLRAFEDEETLEERMAKPKYFNEMLYVKSPFKSRLGKPLYMSIDLPPLEFNRVTDMNNWLSSATPLKVIPELIFNFKTFPEPSKLSKPLELARAPFWVGWLPKPIFNQMSSRGLIDQKLNTSTGEYELGINKKLLHAIHSALPFLSEQSRMFSAPITLEDESPENKRKAYMSGVGFKALDVERELESREGEFGQRESAVTGFYEQRGRLPTTQELKKLTGE